MMKKLVYEYNASLEFDLPVANHQFVLRCWPQSSPRQLISNANVQIKPNVKCSSFIDGFGNMAISGAIPYDHTSFSYFSEGEAYISGSNIEPGQLNPLYFYPSELTKPSEEMVEFYNSLKLPESSYGKALELMAEVNRSINYEIGQTSIETKASEAFSKRAGVCQDFSHIFISLLRLSGVPARYISGLTLGAGPSHSWAEAYIDGSWAGFDPTRLKEASSGYIRIAAGRDYMDCTIERGVFNGAAYQTQSLDINVFEAPDGQ